MYVVAFSASSKTFGSVLKTKFAEWKSPFGLAQNVYQFLVWRKQFGPVQIIFGPVEGQGKSLLLIRVVVPPF